MNDFFLKRKQAVNQFKNLIRRRFTEELTIKDIPELYVLCPHCETRLLQEELKKQHLVCGHCHYHFPMDVASRLQLLVDGDTFVPMFEQYKSSNPLQMPRYDEKLKALCAEKEREAIVTGVGKINGQTFAIGIMDGSFLMGSMGTVVGQRLVKLTEYATDKRLPLLILSTSGGARMQEGILSLMQMAKTNAAIKRHDEAGLFYLSILTDPTYGGVSASFATLADIIIAEPKARIGFAGPRVIKQTMNQVLPKDFQTSEFLLEKGLIDHIVSRHQLKKFIEQLARLHIGKEDAV